MSFLDRRIKVEGCKEEPKVYNKEGKELTPIQPNNIEESNKIDELMARYPSLDYLMCLLLVQSTKEELDNIIKNPPKREMEKTTVIKQDFFIDDKLENIDI